VLNILPRRRARQGKYPRDSLAGTTEYIMPISHYTDWGIGIIAKGAESISVDLFA